MPFQSKPSPSKGTSGNTDASQTKPRASRTDVNHSTLALGGHCPDATWGRDLMAICDQEEGSSQDGFAGLHAPIHTGDTWNDKICPSYSPSSCFRLSGDNNCYSFEEPSHMLNEYLATEAAVSERMFEPVAHKGERKEKQGRKNKPRMKSTVTY